MKPPPLTCPLCASKKTYLFHTDEDSQYWRCRTCLLTFRPRDQHLTHDKEFARYRLHQNDPADPDYRVFLDRLAQQIIPHLPPGADGLDYGSGPGPTLSVMLEEQGYPMNIYDPYFAPNDEVLQQTYDFITCTETAEHFALPNIEFNRFNNLLCIGGWLGIMTSILDDDHSFSNWWYIRDPTHTCFYRKETMRWIAIKFKWRLELPAPNIALFQKSTSN